MIFLLVLFLFLSFILPAIHPTHHQPSEWLSELGLALSLSVAMMDYIHRVEEWKRKYG